jgi:hypothetical protein
MARFRKIEWAEITPTAWSATLRGAEVGFVSKATSYPVLGEWEATSTAPYARSSLATRHKTADEARSAVEARVIEGFAAFEAEATRRDTSPAEFARNVAIAAVREFASELGIMHDPSFTHEATRYADYLRTRDLASEYRVFCGEDPAHVLADRTHTTARSS